MTRNYTKSSADSVKQMDFGDERIRIVRHSKAVMAQDGFNWSDVETTASAHSWVVWASWRDRCWFDISLLEFVCVSLLVV